MLAEVLVVQWSFPLTQVGSLNFIVGFYGLYVYREKLFIIEKNI